MPVLRPLLLVAAAALVSSPVLSVPSVAAPAPTADPAAGAVCSTPLFDQPVRAVTARTSAPAKFATAVSRNGANGDEVREAADADATLWLDTCGRAFYRDQALVDSERAATGAPARRADPRVPEGTDVFALSSRPGASRTIALDFRGEQVSGTAWNEGVGPFTAKPFTIDGNTGGFTEAERLQVYKAWLTVSEDYAPFDVNVTTADVGDDAITRSTRDDSVYGTRVVVSDAPQVSDGCGCGGIAYLDVFDLAGQGHGYYQPAWVFTTGSGTDGWDIGEVASHEAGHNLSLSHDGVGRRDYYSGDGDWAPIMGASFGTPLSQWSRGEYAGATNTEDDLAMIAAAGAPVMVDDHGATALTATPLADGRTARGLIHSSSDVDAFSLGGTGRATVTVSPAAHSADLDAQLTILDATGATVAVVNPKAPSSTSASHPSPDWLGASWTGTLPSAGGWTVLVDGVGAGDPRSAGGYSGYASLGRYTISLTTEGSGPQPNPPSNPQPDPVTPGGTGTSAAELGFVTGSRLPTAVAGRSYRRTIRIDGPDDVSVRWTRGRLPRGVSLRQAGTDVVVRGKPRRAARTQFTLRATSADGQAVTRTFRLLVRR